MRTVAVVVVIFLLFGGLIGVRVFQQVQAAHAPAGGSGTVEGTTLAVTSRLSARIASVDVTEGQAVKGGDVLLTLDCTDADAAVAEARARLEAAKAQAMAADASANASTRASRASAAAARAARAQAEALAAQREVASRQASRLDATGDGTTVAALDQARTQAEGLGHQVDGALASGEASKWQAEAASAQSDAAHAQASAASASVAAAEATVERQLLLQKECRVVSPGEGVVETLPFHVGELVSPGAVLARVVDIHEVTATFYLPNAEVGVVQPGAAAEVLADAFPDTPFAGTVRTISLNAAFTPRNIQTRSDRDRLVYPVEVAIPNPDGRLRPGMPVQVTLPGTER